MADTKKNYNMIDLYKWICSLFVIGIHTQLFLTNIEQAGTAGFNASSTAALLLHTAFKTAVPFFFIISAYFAGKKIDWNNDSDENARIFEKNAARVLKMYLIWMLIYTVPYLWELLSQNGVAKGQVWLLIATSLTGGNYIGIHLWFLLGLGISFTILLYACGRKLANLKWVFIASILLFGIRTLYFYMPIETPDTLFRQFLDVFQIHIFTSLFYCTVGLFIAKYDTFFRDKIPFVLKVVLVIASFIIAVFNLNKDHFLIPLHLTLSVLFLSINLKGSPKIFLMLRMLSTEVYLIHLLVLWVVGMVYGGRTGTIPFLLTAVISNLLAFVYLSVRDRRAGQTGKSREAV